MQVKSRVNKLSGSAYIKPQCALKLPFHRKQIFAIGIVTRVLHTKKAIYTEYYGILEHH